MTVSMKWAFEQPARVDSESLLFRHISSNISHNLIDKRQLSSHIHINNIFLICIFSMASICLRKADQSGVLMLSSSHAFRLEIAGQFFWVMAVQSPSRVHRLLDNKPSQDKIPSRTAVKNPYKLQLLIFTPLAQCHSHLRFLTHSATAIHFFFFFLLGKPSINRKNCRQFFCCGSLLATSGQTDCAPPENSYSSFVAFERFWLF